MTLTGDGKIGIGTSSPQDILDIASGATDSSGLKLTNLNSSSSVTGGHSRVLSVTSAGDVILTQAPFPHYLMNGTNTETTIVRDYNEQVSRGTGVYLADEAGSIANAPNGDWHSLSIVEKDQGRFGQLTMTNKEISFRLGPVSGLSSSPWFTLVNREGLTNGNVPSYRDGSLQKRLIGSPISQTSDGDVGIGITNPEATLHVTGDVKVAGKVSMGDWRASVYRRYSLAVSAGHTKPLAIVRSSPEGSISVLIQVQSKTAGNSGTKLYLFQGGYQAFGSNYDWRKLEPFAVGRGHGDFPEGFDLYVRRGSDFYEYEFGVAANNVAKSLIVTFNDLTGGDVVFTDTSANPEELTTSSGTIYSVRSMNIEEQMGIGTSSPIVSLDAGSKTDAIRVPVGTTGERPVGAPGMIRYNVSNHKLEAYINNSWLELASTPTGGSFLSSSGGTLSGALTISSGGASISGGINNNFGGITNVGNLTGVGSNITGSGALTVAAGGTGENLTLRASTSGSVNIGSGNGTSLSVLDGGVGSVNYVTVKGAPSGSSPVIGTAGSDASINLTFAPKGSGRTIFSSGNVGIGTTSPSHRLHVEGPLKVSGYLDNNSVFTNLASATNIWYTYTSGYVKLKTKSHFGHMHFLAKIRFDGWAYGGGRTFDVGFLYMAPLSRSFMRPR